MQKQEDLQYFYVPVSALPQKMQPQGMQLAHKPYANLDHHTLKPFLGHMLADNATNGTDGNGTGGNETGGGGGPRSCAIDSLVSQADQIFPEWDKCGYIFSGAIPKSEGGEGLEAGDGGVVSAPANDAGTKRCPTPPAPSPHITPPHLTPRHPTLPHPTPPEPPRHTQRTPPDRPT